MRLFLAGTVKETTELGQAFLSIATRMKHQWANGGFFVTIRQRTP